LVKISIDIDFRKNNIFFIAAISSIGNRLVAADSNFLVGGADLLLTTTANRQALVHAQSARPSPTGKFSIGSTIPDLPMPQYSLLLYIILT